MQSFKQRRLAWLSVILAFGVVVAACGSDDDDAGADTGSGEDSGGVNGFGGTSAAVGYNAGTGNQPGAIVASGQTTGNLAEWRNWTTPNLE